MNDIPLLRVFGNRRPLLRVIATPLLNTLIKMEKIVKVNIYLHNISVQLCYLPLSLPILEV